MYNNFELSDGDNMTQDELKNEAAKAALQYITPGTIIGVGTGSTANFFIDHLSSMKDSCLLYTSPSPRDRG